MRKSFQHKHLADISWRVTHSMLSKDFKLSEAKEKTWPVTGDVGVCACSVPYIIFIYLLSVSLIEIRVGPEIRTNALLWPICVLRDWCECVPTLAHFEDHTAALDSTQEIQYMNYLCNKLISWKQSVAQWPETQPLGRHNIAHRKYWVKIFRHAHTGAHTHSQARTEKNELSSGRD